MVPLHLSVFAVITKSGPRYKYRNSETEERDSGNNVHEKRAIPPDGKNDNVADGECGDRPERRCAVVCVCGGCLSPDELREKQHRYKQRETSDDSMICHHRNLPADS